MDTSLKFRKLLFQVNACFLMLMGGVFAILDYVGYRTGQGPLGRILHDNTLAIGMQEAHRLAFLFGLALFIYTVPDMRSSWHLFCAGVHILLGGSNLIYWNSVFEYGIVGPEIIVTTTPRLFVMPHIVILFLIRNLPSPQVPRLETGASHENKFISIGKYALAAFLILSPLIGLAIALLLPLPIVFCIHRPVIATDLFNPGNPVYRARRRTKGSAQAPAFIAAMNWKLAES